MSTTLVIAYGNPLCGDDGVAAAMVRGPDAGPTPPGVRVLMPQLLTLELAEDIARVERVVFVDAAVDGRPGTVRCEPVHPRLSVLSAIAHHLDPDALMGWTRRLFDAGPEAWVITVTGRSFEIGDELSPEVVRAVPEARDVLRELLDRPVGQTVSEGCSTG